MPSRHIGRHAGSALAFVILIATSTPAQQAATRDVQAPRDRVLPPRTGTAVIKGRVVDGTSGAAVARARVTVQGGPRQSVLTDAGGGFSFTNLPAGQVMISVEKPTFLSTRYPTPGRTIRANSRPLLLSNGQVLENVTIPIFHGAAITGRVLDANGDSLDNAQVSVIRVPSSGRLGRLSARSGSSTDDRGEFRIGRLEAGEYIVQATAARRGPMFEDMTPGATPAPPSPQPLPTYYPGAMTIEQAQPITLARGQTVTDIDVILSEALPGVITGSVTTANGAPIAGSNTSISTRRIVSEATGGVDNFVGGAGVRPDGTFRITLPPGEYQLEARVSSRTTGGPPRPEDEQFGMVKVTVSSGAEDSVAIVAGRGASASGRVIFEGDTAPPPSPGKGRIPMFSENGQCLFGEVTIAADWSFHVEGLNGTCSSQPMGMFGRWLLKSVIVNGEDIADAPVTFEPGQQLRNVQVIVTDKRSSLSFRVSDDSGQATSDYVVVVFPVEKARWQSARIFMAPPPAMTAAGHVPATAVATWSVGMPMPPRRDVMGGLRPGEYYAVAVDDMEQEEYRDPAVLDRLRSRAVRVTIPEGSTVDVPLRRVRFANARNP